jgi:hypothetical protein
MPTLRERRAAQTRVSVETVEIERETTVTKEP